MQHVHEIASTYAVLGLDLDATAEQVRAAYLALVQKFPPDREPQRFAQIHQAYEWLSDPLAYARDLTEVADGPPNLMALVEAAAAKPPRLTPAQLLSLGNVNP